jgi:chromosome segregation ATPase
MKAIPFGAIVAVVAVVATLGATRAAGQPAAHDADVMSALLVEVRGLRAAMEQIASAGPRVQLATGRLQLQEQRLNAMLRRLDDLRERIAGADSATARRREELKRAQEAAQTAEPEHRRALEQEARELKMIVDSESRDTQRLRAEEAELANSVAGEQARWMDINQRLEDLERALTRR